jgi:hypothetical protein
MRQINDIRKAAAALGHEGTYAQDIEGLLFGGVHGPDLLHVKRFHSDGAAFSKIGHIKGVGVTFGPELETSKQARSFPLMTEAQEGGPVAPFAQHKPQK